MSSKVYVGSVCDSLFACSGASPVSGGSETDNGFALVPGSNLSWNTTDETLREVSVISLARWLRCMLSLVSDVSQILSFLEYRRSASLVRF